MRLLENKAAYEGLKFYQDICDIRRKVYLISERFRIQNQIERSSSSVADNIAEGHTSYYYQDKIKGFNVARKEAGETQNHVKSMEGKGYITPSKTKDLLERYEEVIRGINGYIRWVREKRESRPEDQSISRRKIRKSGYQAKPDILMP